MVILTRQGVRRFSSELLLAIELRIDSIRGGEGGDTAEERYYGDCNLIHFARWGHHDHKIPL